MRHINVPVAQVCSELSPTDPSWGAWTSFSSSRSWTLFSGPSDKKVCGQFRNAAGDSPICGGQIELVLDPPTCDSWVSVRINECTFSKYTQTPRHPDCIIEPAGVTVYHFVDNNPTQMRHINVSPSVVCANVSPTDPNWTAWTSYSASRSWNLTAESGEKKVCAQFRHNSGESQICGAQIERLIPSCTVSLDPPTAEIPVGGSQPFLAVVNATPSDGVDQVDYTSNPTGIVTLNRTSQTPPPSYTVTATGANIGSTNVRVGVIMSGIERCFATSSVTVINPGPWWQVVDANVIAGGSLTSLIPGTCVVPGCIPVLNLKGAGLFPGITIFGETYDFQAGSGQGAAAEDPYNWLARTVYSGKKYDLDFFYNQLPQDIKDNMYLIDHQAPGADFWNGIGNGPADLYKGYRWYYYDRIPGSPLLIEGNNINLTGSGGRVVLFAKNASVWIDGNINVEDGQSFFMVIAGKRPDGQFGEIRVNQDVTSLEGIYLAEWIFRTRLSNQQLTVRGSVVAYDNFLLQRNLQAGNVGSPAELFIYGPDQVIRIPP